MRLLRLACACLAGSLLAVPVMADSTLVFPHLPAGGAVTVQVTLTNTNFDAPVTGTLSVFGQNGAPRVIAVDGQAAASTFRLTIPAGGSVTLTTAPGGEVTLGMARFVSDLPAGGVVRFQVAGSQIGVLGSASLAFGTLVFDNTGGNDTGLAISNPGSDPINLTLVHAGPGGEVIETIEPADLNPLPANGQVSKFLAEFGFRQTGNRSGNTIRIQPRSGGKFSALGLILRGGQLASTAVVKGATGRFAFEEFGHIYTGVWRNTTFSTSGTAIASMTANLVANIVVVNLTLGGQVFGSPVPAGAIVLFGTFSERGFTATGNAPPFGPMTMTVGPDGSFTLTANSVPNPAILSLRITGTAHPDRIVGNFTVTFRAAGSTPAAGTIALNHTSE